MKAIIIGAGIGGLTAGIALEQAGLDVEIFEREPELRAVGAGLTLWANAIHALDKIRLGDALREHSIMGSKGGIHSQSGQDIMVTDTDTMAKYVGIPNVVIHRAELQALLLEHFNGIIHYTKSLISYQQQNNQVCVQFDDSTTAEGDLLIGCDGIHSVVRGKMFPATKPIYSGYTAYRGIADFDHSQVGDMWGEAWGYGNRFGITPLSDNRVYWFATANAAEHNITPIGLRQQTLLDVFAGWHNPISDLIKATSEVKILQHGIYEIAPMKSWQDGHVVLLGDAAHAMTPNLGQGACQAIEDAVVLGELFKRGSNIAENLTRYQTMRLPRSNQILKQSQLIGKVGQIENKILCDLRNAMFRMMPNVIRMKPLMDVISYRI